MHSQPAQALATFDTALLFVIGEIDASEQTERAPTSLFHGSDRRLRKPAEAHKMVGQRENSLDRD